MPVSEVRTTLRSVERLAAGATAGFTSVELLAVIVIMGILLVVAVPAVLSFSQNIKNDMFCTKVETAEKAAQLYGQDNIDYISTHSCNSIKKGNTTTNVSSCDIVTVKALLRKGYLKKEAGVIRWHTRFFILKNCCL